MPIMTRGDERILYSHIPKTGGSSLAAWFLANGWKISNLIAGPDGLAKYVRDHYKIGSFALEGEQPKNVAPQHATRIESRKWGHFTYEFTIVRDPFARYCSQVNYAARAHFEKKGSAPSEEQYRWFCDKYHDAVIEKIDEIPSIEDNHFRPQVEFVDDGFEIFKLEQDDWISAISTRFGLKDTPPRLNAAPASAAGSLSPDKAKLAWLSDYYAQDYKRFGYVPAQ